MNQYRPYPAYRVSGVEWVGSIPTTWGVKPIWSFASCNDDSLGEDTSQDFTFRYVDISSVNYTYGITSTEQFRFGDAPSRARRRAQTGDIVVSTVRTYLKAVAAVDDEHADCVFSTGFAVLRARRGQVTPRFMKWLMLNDLLIQAVESHSEGLSYPAINSTELVKLKTTVPSVPEQEAISSVLERETGRIDALIAKKREFIALLDKKRQALITHAVTKGLNSKAKMRDSAVEWMGAVPAHWKISKLGYEVSECGGKTPSTENAEYWGGDIPWVTPKDMKVDVIADSIDKITATAAAECGMATIPPGSVLAVVRGMILAHSFPVAETAGPVTINQDMKALVPGRGLLSSYLKLLLQSAKSYVVAVLVAEAAHGTRVLRSDIWRQLPMLLPPIEEQQLICAHVTKVVNRFAKLTALTKASIDLLKQRRSALITAAVTGQIDLRESA